MVSKTCVYYLPFKPKIAWIAVVTLLGVVLLMAALNSSSFSPHKLILYNTTASMPFGYYRLHHNATISDAKRGDIVVYPIPEKVLRLVLARNYVKADVPLMKPLTAVPGDYVCTQHRRVVVNKKVLGDIPYNDSQDRPLPYHRYCGHVPDGFFYSFSERPHSFDSRHYGPIPSSFVTATASPLWTW